MNNNNQVNPQSNPTPNVANNPTNLGNSNQPTVAPISQTPNIPTNPLINTPEVPVTNNLPPTTAVSADLPPTTPIPTQDNPAYKPGSKLIAIFLVPILYGLIPSLLTYIFFFVLMFTALDYFLIGFLVIVMILIYFLFSLFLNNTLPNTKPKAVIAIVLLSAVLVFLWNSFTCAISMLVPCDPSELYSPLSLLYSYFGHILSLSTFFIGRKFIKSRQGQGSEKIRIPTKSIAFILLILLLLTPTARNYIKESYYSVKHRSEFKVDQVEDSNELSGNYDFQQSISNALLEARKIEKDATINMIRIAEEYDAESLDLIPNKDIVLYTSTNEKAVTIAIDGRTGKIKDSSTNNFVVFTEGGIEDVSQFKHSPFEAIEVVKKTKRFSELPIKDIDEFTPVVWAKPFDNGTYYWEIFGGFSEDQPYLDMEFWVSTEDLSILKAYYLSFDRPLEIPTNDKSLPVEIDPSGGEIYYNSSYSFTMRYPTGKLDPDIDSFDYEGLNSSLSCNFFNYDPRKDGILNGNNLQEANPKIVKANGFEGGPQYFLLQDGFPKVEMSCYDNTTKDLDILEKMLLTIEFEEI